MHTGGFTREIATTPNTILFGSYPIMSVSVVVDDTGITATNGKKVIKAGSPMAGDLATRTTPFKLATISGSSDAVGVLLHDVDVTSGKANATLTIFGFIDLAKLDTTTKALITTEVKAALKGSVTFLA